MEPLLREHLALRKELTAALLRSLQPSTDPEEARRFEQKCAGALHRVLSHLTGLTFESMRRGVDPGRLEPLYRRMAGNDGGLDPSFSLDTGGAGRIDPKAMAAWSAGARAGRAAAQYLLGAAQLFRATSGAAAAEGLQWLEKSAAQDFGPAALMLARILEFGEGVNRDLPRALELLRSAAGLGLPDGCWRLAMHHLSGSGVPQDPSKVLSYLETAAEAGHPEAQLELGRLRAVGWGGEDPDHAQALRWLTAAAAQHRALAREWIDRYGRMSPGEYLNEIWLEAWTPSELPHAPRAGLVGILVSLGIGGLLIAAAAAGNSLSLFLLLLFFAIILHEAGHWAAARWTGIPILVFSVGVGPLVRSLFWKRDRLPMRIDLRLLPLMGSVQPYAVPRSIWAFWQERSRREEAGQPPPPVPDFDRKEEPEAVSRFVPPRRRLAYIFGGLAVNLIAAVGFLWLYEQNSDVARLWTVPVAGPVAAGSIADQAGIREGDRFLTVDGKPVHGFFEVQRRLAPRPPAEGTGVPPDPPGTTIPLVVRRDGAEVPLSWRTPDAAPAGDPDRGYGLAPVETWRVRGVPAGGAGGIQPGDEVVEFQGEGPAVSVHEPEARRLFLEAFATGGVVKLGLRRDGAYREAKVKAAPDRDPGGSGTGKGRPPFDFELQKEIGPARGLLEVTGRVVKFGWNAVGGLPRAILESFRSRPTREEQGALLSEVRRDPWAGVRTFALIHAFLLFLNLVPIPPLDGFQLLCCLLEMGARRPLPKGGMVLAMRVGWILMGLWLVLNVVLILMDLGSSVL